MELSSSVKVAYFGSKRAQLSAISYLILASPKSIHFFKEMVKMLHLMFSSKSYKLTKNKMTHINKCFQKNWCILFYDPLH